MIVEFIKGKRFPLVILAAAFLAGGLWFLQPQFGWLPLLIALAPWILRLAFGGTLPLQTSPLDLPLALFLATAAGGMWLAYDQEAAQAKYWLIIGAIFIYYAHAAQPRQNYWLVAGLLTLFGVGIASYFLLTHDWQEQPAKIQLFNQIGLRLMAIRPSLNFETIHPNVAAGISAVVLPFPIAIGLRGLRRDRKWFTKIPVFLFSGLTVLFLLFVLLLTTSRGAWLALGAALLFWLIWESSSFLAVTQRLKPHLVFMAIIVTLGTVGVFILLTYPGGPLGLIEQLPGPSNVGSRAGLVRDMLLLISDFPLFGAGLGSFPGLYSQYILIIPTFILGHSHDLLLDITLEQGPLGLFAFVCVLGGSFLILARFKSRKRLIRHLSLLRWATTSSILVMLLHGLIDDPLYGSRAVLFLFMIPGFAVALSRPYSHGVGDVKTRSQTGRNRFNYRMYAAGAVLTIILFSLVAFLNRNEVLSAWYANRGAVEMARIELADWPTDKWDDGRSAASLSPARDLFNQALEVDPLNVTAHYRLGMIALLNRNYPQAVGHLETAYLLAPGNQGIQKTLGYSYVWSGDFDHAFARLHPISEARQEMTVYVNWWNVQGRQDLSANAAIMVQRLQTIEPGTTN